MKRFTHNEIPLAATVIAIAIVLGLGWGLKEGDPVAIAAWVQAFGTIGAVIGAAMIARWQFSDLTKRKKSERQAKAAVTAYLLIPRYVSLLNQLQILADMRDNHEFGTIFMNSVPAQELVERLIISAPIPSKFESEIHCFDALTAMFVAQTVAFTDEYNRFVSEALPRLYQSEQVFNSHFLSAIKYKFQLVERVAKQAVERLAKYHSNELAVMERL